MRATKIRYFFIPCLLAMGCNADISAVIIEPTIDSIHQILSDGTHSCRDLIAANINRAIDLDSKPIGAGSISSLEEIYADVLSDAARIDEQIRRGENIGSLGCIPVVAKANIEVSGRRITAGSKVFSDMVATEDAEVISRLKKAGAIIVGRAAMDELAMSNVGADGISGQIRSPYNTGHHPTGSSGGTASALAANFATLGLGTDTCGSIRGPASHSGLVGLRPTTGLIPNDGIFPVSSTADTVGPMARSVADVASMLEVMTDGRQSYRNGLNTYELAGTKIGVIRAYTGVDEAGSPAIINISGLNTDVDEVLEQAIVSMQEQGALIQDVTLDGWAPFQTWLVPIVLGEFEVTVDNYLQSRTNPPVSSFRDIGTHTESSSYIRSLIASLDNPMFDVQGRVYRSALDVRQQMIRYLQSIMDDSKLDVLLYASQPLGAAPLVTNSATDLPTSTSEIISCGTGFPALTVPAGVSLSGLPIGIEFLSRPFDEGRLLSIGFAYEQATQHRVVPDLVH